MKETKHRAYELAKGVEDNWLNADAAPYEAAEMLRKVPYLESEVKRLTHELTCIVEIIESYQIPCGNSAAGEMAAEWTLDALREIRDEIQKRIS